MRLLAALLLVFTACGPEEVTAASTAPITGATQVSASTAAGPNPHVNPAGCPATWPEARQLCASPTACTVGTQCWYPQMGDPTGHGDWSDALLDCSEPGGTIDAGTAEWHCAQ